MKSVTEEAVACSWARLGLLPLAPTKGLTEVRRKEKVDSTIAGAGVLNSPHYSLRSPALFFAWRAKNRPLDQNCAGVAEWQTLRT